jgi:uncharacterized repeat protein (TIGR03803 family)
MARGKGRSFTQTSIYDAVLRARPRPIFRRGAAGYVVERLETRRLLSTFSTLASFPSPATSKGSGPLGNLAEDSSGNLYGTTNAGGANSDGTVFELPNGSSTFTTIATFNGTNGSAPNGGVVLDGSGDLFGTANTGGANGFGDVWEVANGASTITDLANFNATLTGKNPIGNLVIDGSGNLYGTAKTSGSGGQGTTWELTSGGSTITALASFNTTNGKNPYGGIVLSGSTIYGTTRVGGANGNGEIYKISSGTLSTLYTFSSLTGGDNADGADPDDQLVMDSNGNLYGTTEQGGVNGAGTVFEYSTGNSTFTTIVSFTTSTGATAVGKHPFAGLTMDAAGNLFGATLQGATNNEGAVFEIAAGTSTLTDLHTFSALTSGDNSDGATPEYGAMLMDSKGDLFGEAFTGGTAGFGTIFQISPATILAFKTQPSTATAGVADSLSITVAVENEWGDTLTGDTSNVTLAINTGPGSIGGTDTVAAVAGVATFSNVVINTAGSYTLAASDGSYTGANSSSFTVNPASASKVVYNVQPSSVTAGVADSPSIVVDVEDQFNNIVTGDSSNVTLAIASGPGAISGTDTVAASSGVATFSNVILDTAGSYTLTASDGSLTTATSGSFTVSAASASQVAFSQQPTGITAGGTISPGVTVDVEDQFGNLVTGDSSNVTIAKNSGPGSLSGTLTEAASSGVATFSDLSIVVAGAYTLAASDGSLTSANSGSFNVTATTASKVVYSVQPSSVAAGVADSPSIVVDVEDQYNNIVTTDSSSVTLAVASGPGSATGTLTVGASSGVATFSNVKFNTLGTYTLTASDGSLTTATSGSFSVTPAGASQLAFNVQPSDVTAGVADSPSIVVYVEDPFGNIVTTDSSNVTLSVATGGGSTSGTVTVAASSGVATFSNLILDTAGAHTLTASDGSLTTATSSSFNVSPTSASKVVYNVQPSTVTAGVAVSPSIVVDVEDQFGNIVTGDSSNVTLAVASGGGSVSGTATVAASSGVATFSNVKVDTAGAHTLTASDGSLTTATSSSFTVNPAAAAKVVYGTQPSGVVAGVADSPSIVLDVEDQFGNIVTTDSSNVTLSVASGPGSLSGTRGSSDYLVDPNWTGANGAAGEGYAGVFTSVTAALTTGPLAASSGSSAASPNRLFIDPGTYNVGTTSLAYSKNNIDIIGIDSVTHTNADVVITSTLDSAYNNGSSTLGTSGSATLQLKGNNVAVANLTIANGTDTPYITNVVHVAVTPSGSYTGNAQTAGGGSAPAVALLSQGDGQYFNNVSILGYQDTLYLKGGRSLFNNCYINDNDDGIFGSGTAVFTNSVINNDGNHNGGCLTAASTDKRTSNGLVFLNSTITMNSSSGNSIIDPYNAGVTQATMNTWTSGSYTWYLGRPWGWTQAGGDASTIFIDNTINTSNLSTNGWLAWDSTETTANSKNGGNPGEDSRFATYGNVDLSDNPLNTAGYVSWSHTLSPTQAAMYTVANIFSFDPSTPGGGWFGAGYPAGDAAPGSGSPDINPGYSFPAFWGPRNTQNEGTVEGAGVAGGNPTAYSNPTWLAAGGGVGLGVNTTGEAGAFGNGVWDPSVQSATIPDPLTVAASGGVATFSNVKLDTAGSYTLTASDGSLTSATSNSFTVSPAAASQVVYSVQPSNVTAGVADSPSIVVDVEDQFGNLVTSDSSNITLAIATGPGSLSGTTTVAASSGVATFSNAILDTAGSYTLTASDGGLSSATSGSFTVSPAAPSKVVYSVAPSNTTAGAADSPAIVVDVEDQFNNIVTSDSSNVTVAVASGPGSASGTTTVAASSGVATLSNVIFDTLGTYTLTASDASLTTATSGSFTVGPAVASHLVYHVQPSDVTAGVADSPSIVVYVEDPFGNVASADSSNVTLSVATGPGSASGTLTVAASSGIATFSNVKLDTSGSYTLTASDGSLTSATSSSFNVSAAAAAKVAYGVQPSSVTAGVAISPPIVVDVEDQFGNIVAGDSSNVTLAIASGGGSLGGTTTVAASSGVATFSNITLDTAGAHTLTASDGSLTSATSGGFAVNAAAASKVVYSVQPSDVVAGVADSPSIVVDVEDQFGNIATGNSSNVTLAVATGPGSLSGTTTVAASSGVATFSNIKLNTVGTYTLTASDGALTTDASSSFAVGPAAASKVVYSVQPSNVTAGVADSPSIVVDVEDQFGNLVTGNSSNVTLSVATGPGSLSGTTTVAASGGVATFSNIIVDTAGSYTLTATDGALTTATSGSFTVSPTAASKVVYNVQPSNVVAGVADSPSIVVDVEDQFGNIVTGNSSNVTLAVATGPGSLSGTTTVAASSGIATFSNIKADTVGSYTLTASDGVLTSATSGSFTVTPAAASKVVYSVQPSNVAAGIADSPSIVVDVEDQFGNVATSNSSNVTLAVASGPGSASGTLTVAASSGVATFANVKLDTAGSYTLSATDGALTTATSGSFTVSPAAASKVVYSVQPGNVVAGVAESPAIVVDIEDQFGNLVTGNSSNVTLSAATGPGSAGGTTTVAASGGVATFNNLLLDKAGSYTLGAADGALTSAVSNSFTVSHAAAAGLAFAATPADTQVNHTITPAVDVDVVDAFGNLVPTDNSNVTIALTTGPGTLSGTLTVAASSGVASFADLAIDTAGADKLTATDGSLASATSNTFYTGGVLSQLVVVSQTSNATPSGTVPLNVTIAAEDINDVLVITDTSTVTATIHARTAGGATTETSTAQFSNGYANFHFSLPSQTGTYSISFADGVATAAAAAPVHLRAVPLKYQWWYKSTTISSVNSAGSQFGAARPTGNAAVVTPALNEPLVAAFTALPATNSDPNAPTALNPTSASALKTPTSALNNSNRHGLVD